MRWIVDERVHRLIVDNLRNAGHSVLFVTEQFPSSPDVDVYSVASAESRVLLSHDLDYGELLFRDRLAPLSGVVLLRLRPSAMGFQWRRLQFAIDQYGDALMESFTVIEDARIRSRPLV
jgi:predicted nuclease of predicted toxin-antitoxin system